VNWRKEIDPAWLLVPLLTLIGLGGMFLAVRHYLQTSQEKRCYVINCFYDHLFNFDRARHNLLVKIERRYRGWLEEVYGVDVGDMGSQFDWFDAGSEEPRERIYLYSHDKVRAEGWMMALSGQVARLGLLLLEETREELRERSAGARGVSAGVGEREAGEGLEEEDREEASEGLRERDRGERGQGREERDRGEASETAELGRRLEALAYEPSERIGGVKLSNTRHTHIVLQFHRKQFAYLAETVKINDLLLGSPYRSPFLKEARAHQRIAEEKIVVDEPEDAIDHYVEAQFLLLFLIDEQQMALGEVLGPSSRSVAGWRN